jgi:hypothetical protein
MSTSIVLRTSPDWQPEVSRVVNFSTLQTPSSEEQLNFKNTPNDILKPVDPNAADEDLAYYRPNINQLSAYLRRVYERVLENEGKNTDGTQSSSSSTQPASSSR